MILEQLVSPGTVLCNVLARSKKHSLEILSELLANPNPDTASQEIFARLVERERLGSTSLGKGTAFPHCRMAGVQSSCAALMKLSEAVDFDSPDGVLVDLIFGLVLPGDSNYDDHAVIDSITGFLSNGSLIAKLRNANSSSELYNALLAGQDMVSTEVRSAQRFL